MTDFQHVIEDGTVDEIKDCVYAVVYLPPPLRKLKHPWTVEHSQDLVAMYSISADAVITRALTETLQTEQILRERGVTFDADAIEQMVGQIRRPRRIKMRLTSR
jgi:hypothetical protein